ncbi:hypothetical protein DNJ95_11155 [Stutzerimonas kirkiae]|uniref:Uncharacterized protein n=2 Tax=Stutzerimonas kirkiae TaxID=2211392 RepID=A0A4Q9R5K1_9GAMM|nr:hypothetical protein DNJ96_12555 [Stutzerimonas kirkiae]TBV01889.1 hypothetical protein DNJ95_11155 [Stutzerimonas kirkiae]TBV08457.1 hypothetical protein DNK01_18950 [Stutzerimonas kirkiae]
MNSFATLHDQWMIDLKVSKGGVDMTFVENIGSMPPAFILNYGAVYDKYRVVIDRAKNSIEK